MSKTQDLYIHAKQRIPGGRVLFHSCGNIDATLEDLADMGIDALTNLQVKAGMDLASAVKRIGDRVTIVGNVDATGIMCQSDQTKIDDAIRTVVETAGKDGGLIIATDHSFHEGIPQENVLYFIETAKRIGAFTAGKDKSEEPILLGGTN